MTQLFLSRAVKIGFSLTLIVSLSAALFGRALWAFGALTAACWMFLNVYFLYRLLSASLGVDPSARSARKPGRVLVLSVLKFPVIYLAGYYILKARYFPVESVLAGLTAFVAGLVISWVTVQKKEKLGFLILVPTALFFFGNSVLASEEAGHAQAAHGASHDSALHTTNLVGLVSRFLPEHAAGILTGYENVIFGVIVIAILSLIFFSGSRNMRLVPGRLQTGCEAVVEGLDGFVCGIIGPEGRKYTPFLGTLFLYILTMNLLGLVPLMKSNTANSMMLSGPIALPVPTTTVALALIVFVTVQAIGIKKQGLLGYLDHMAGSPRDMFGYVMVPLMFPIHLIGEFAKPFSLTFRLFCNTMGGHILVAVFIGMGVTSMLIPFQAPFLLFEVATSTIQAFVFTLLSTVYIAMMMPHGDHEKHHSTAEIH